jgi:hypothetical protein
MTATAPAKDRSPRTSATAELNGLLKAIENVVEEERARLMSAEAVLHCAAIAMEGDERGAADKPHYPSVIDVARGLVAQSICQLLYLKPMLEKIREQGGHSVKEHTSIYLH